MSTNTFQVSGRCPQHQPHSWLLLWVVLVQEGQAELLALQL